MCIRDRVDVVRPHTPGEYTYWDYQAGRFTKDEGMRIDFQLFSPRLPHAWNVPGSIRWNAPVKAQATTRRSWLRLPTNPSA